MTRRFRNKTLVFLALCAALAVCGCNRSIEYWADSYIQMYLGIDGIRFRQDNPGAFRFISIGRSGAFNGSGDDKAWFDEVCAANGDLTFGRKVYLVLGIPNILAYTPDIVSIDVFCNDYYDSEHPAGASLNDYITIEYSAAWNYIKGNYQGNPPTPVRKTLSELGPQDLRILLYPDCKLDFAIKPEQLALHSMTITMRLFDGQEYTSEFKYDFDTGKLVPPRTPDRLSDD